VLGVLGVVREPGDPHQDVLIAQRQHRRVVFRQVRGVCRDDLGAGCGQPVAGRPGQVAVGVGDGPGQVGHRDGGDARRGRIDAVHVAGRTGRTVL